MSRLLLILASAVAGAAAFRRVPHDGPLPVPTPQQLAYQGSISGLIHFGMATFFHDGDPGCTRSNWNACESGGGCNSSNPASFAPSNLNISSWVASFQALGATSAVLTAKHGCGFLGWRTATTLPDGSLYPYTVSASQRVVESFVEHMSAAGLGYGFYYSLTNNFFLNVAGHYVQPANTLLPGQALVTQAQYEDLAIAQMHELWTQFGPLTEIWMDGGCLDLCPRVAALLNATLARDAVAFNGGGTSIHGVRWCGTEGGNPSKGPGGAVWSTAACQPSWCAPGSGSGDSPNTTGAIYYPSGVDFTLQTNDHWFYTPNQPLHSLADLIAVYHSSVGANGHLELDFAIDRTGGVDPAHAARYAEFGDWIRACYGTPLATGSAPASSPDSVTVALAGGATVDRVGLSEDQSAGQLSIDYVVEVSVGGGAWAPFSSGTTIGARRIDVRAPVAGVTAVRATVVSAFAAPKGLRLAVYAPCAAA